MKRKKRLFLKKIKNIIKEYSHNQEKLIDILFIKAIYEHYFQPLFFKLYVELDIFLLNKKEKLKISIKKSINNKYYVLGNISFII